MSEHEQLRLLLEQQKETLLILGWMSQRINHMAKDLASLLSENAATQAILDQQVAILQTNQDKFDADIGVLTKGINDILAALAAAQASPGTFSPADQASVDAAQAAAAKLQTTITALATRSSATATALDNLDSVAVPTPTTPPPVAPAPAA